MAKHIYKGSGAPNTAPIQVGHHYIDITNGKSYISVGTSTSADWKLTESTAASTAQEKYVSQLSGSDTTGDGSEKNPYATIKKALSMITDSSATKPYSVIILPGIYTEDNSAGPITIPNRVNLRSQSRFSAILKLTTPANIGFTYGFHNIVDGFGIIGGSAAFFQAISKTKWGLFNINFAGGAKLITVNGGSSDIFIENIFAGTPPTGFIEILGGAFVRAKNIEYGGSGTAFSITGTSTRLNIENCRVSGVTQAFHLADTAKLDFDTIKIVSSSIGIHAHNSAVIEGRNLDCYESVTSQLVQVDSTVIINITGAIFNQDSISILNWDNVNLNFEDVKTGQTTIANGLMVGVPENGEHAQFGEGGEYTRGMKVYTYDGATFVDKTADLLTEGGNTVGLPNTSVNTAMYFGSALVKSDSTPIKFWGLGLYLTQMATLGAGTLTWEYWNGSAWTSFYVMGYIGDGSYLPVSQKIFTSVVDEVYTQFSDVILKDWTANDPVTLGTNYFWVRCSISTTITTSFLLDAVTVLASHSSLTGDGFSTYHGAARPIQKLDLSFGSFETALAPPTNQDILLGDVIDIGRSLNLFANTTTARIGAALQLPLDIDTSCPIRLRITYFNTTNTGSTDWVCKWAISNTGDTIHISTTTAPTAAPDEQTITRSTAVPGTANTQMSEVFELYIPNAVAEKVSSGGGSVVWVTLQRNGSADSNAGSVIMIDFIPYYTAWRSGGHISNWV